jgi:hypothetical protein
MLLLLVLLPAPCVKLVNMEDLLDCLDAQHAQLAQTMLPHRDSLHIQLVLHASLVHFKNIAAQLQLIQDANPAVTVHQAATDLAGVLVVLIVLVQLVVDVIQDFTVPIVVGRQQEIARAVQPLTTV